MEDFLSPAQLFGWAGAVCYCASFLLTSPRKTIFLWIPGNIFFGIHFLMLGSVAAFIIAVLALVRDVFGVYAKGRPFYIALYVCIALAWLGTMVFATGWHDYFPVIGNTFLTFAVLSRDSFMKHRLFSFAHQGSWLAFGFFILSYPLIVECVLLIGANILGIRRYRQGKKAAARAIPAVLPHG